MLKSTCICAGMLAILTECLISSNVMVLADSPKFNQCMEKFSNYTDCLIKDTYKITREIDNIMEKDTYLNWMSLKKDCSDGENAACSNLDKLRNDITYDRNIVKWRACDEPNEEQCIRRYVGEDYRGLP